jgi:hypothetical protein
MDPTFGSTVLGRLASPGQDFLLQTSDDTAVNFFEAEVLSRVQGYVRDTQGAVVPGVELVLNYPLGGVLATQTLFTDAAGYYSASGVSFGNRSITIKPKLVIASGATTVSGGGGSDLTFTVRNYSLSNITVASLTAAYTLDPEAWFNQIVVGGTMVYNSNNPRFGNGDTVTFTPITLQGNGLPEESVPIRVQSPVTDVADLVVGKAFAGGSLVVEFRNFRDVETGGGGSNVDVAGVPFEITFRDAANNVVGVVTVTP